jgi:hypothetical protein
MNRLPRDLETAQVDVATFRWLGPERRGIGCLASSAAEVLGLWERLRALVSTVRHYPVIVGNAQNVEALEDELQRAWRSWQARFGAGPVGVSGATVELRVERPISDPREALRVALEHYAYCPDTVLMTEGPFVEGRAAGLLGSTVWHFWWD